MSRPVYCAIHAFPLNDLGGLAQNNPWFVAPTPVSMLKLVSSMALTVVK